MLLNIRLYSYSDSDSFIEVLPAITNTLSADQSSKRCKEQSWHKLIKLIIARWLSTVTKQKKTSDFLLSYMEPSIPLNVSVGMPYRYTPLAPLRWCIKAVPECARTDWNCCWKFPPVVLLLSCATDMQDLPNRQTKQKASLISETLHADLTGKQSTKNRWPAISSR